MRDNRQVVNLSDDQQVKLLTHVVKPYEQIVKKSISVILKQNEFDALVSFAYNPAGRWTSVTNFVNKGQVNAAMDKIREGNTSGGVVMRGLTDRRTDEVNLYTNGVYEFAGHPISTR